jgi:hypothetical protein
MASTYIRLKINSLISKGKKYGQCPIAGFVQINARNVQNTSLLNAYICKNRKSAGFSIAKSD